MHGCFQHGCQLQTVVCMIIPQIFETNYIVSYCSSISIVNEGVGMKIMNLQCWLVSPELPTVLNAKLAISGGLVGS